MNLPPNAPAVANNAMESATMTGGGQQRKVFASDAEAEAAFKTGAIRSGEEIVINGRKVTVN